MEFDENLNPIEPPLEPDWRQTPPPSAPSFNYQAPPPEPPRTQTPPPPPPKPPVTPPPFTPPLPPKPLSEPEGSQSRRPAPPVNVAKRVLDLITIVVVVGLVIGIISVARGGSPTPATSSIGEQGLTVTGEGTSYVTPDVAKIDFGVSTEAKNLADSQKLNSEAIAKIKDALQAYNIEAKDIKTLYYTINPEYNYISSRAPQLRGYTTRHTIEITVRKLEDADSVVQTLGNSGATEVNQVQFTVDDPSEVQNDAREKAIAQAKEKAKQLADLSGAHLGRIISINESTPSSDGFYPKFSEGMGGGSSIAVPGLEEGSMAVISNVTITYSLN